MSFFWLLFGWAHFCKGIFWSTFWSWVPNWRNIQILSIVEDTVPAMSIALTSHHSTRWKLSKYLYLDCFKQLSIDKIHIYCFDQNPHCGGELPEAEFGAVGARQHTLPLLGNLQVPGTGTGTGNLRYARSPSIPMYWRRTYANTLFLFGNSRVHTTTIQQRWIQRWWRGCSDDNWQRYSTSTWKDLACNARWW